MAAAAAISFVPVEEYLHTSYEPDMDYVDGYLEDRHVGEIEHSDLQGEVLTILRVHAKSWGIYAFPEQRVQVTQQRYRVPDVCVMPRTWTKTKIIRQAPLLCIEILSPEDTFSRTQVKCRDYITMGVPEVWILDPEDRKVFVWRGDAMHEQSTGKLRLAGTDVEVDLTSVFAVLDE